MTEHTLAPFETIEAVPLTAEAYTPYGAVIETKFNQHFNDSANYGTAKRFDWITDLKNLRSETAKLNICVFRSSPRTLPFKITKLERHPFSTQMFIPMTAQRYLVIVALGGDTPGLYSLFS